MLQVIEHSVYHGDVYHGFAGFGVSFVIFGVSAVLADPCEGAFGDPAFRQHDEAFHFDRSQYRLRNVDTLGQPNHCFTQGGKPQRLQAASAKITFSRLKRSPNSSMARFAPS
jgi:hypothetical protein